ncbi:MAG: hypothetical protein ABII00_00890 [Elusimicrobiota bacterium]
MTWTPTEAYRRLLARFGPQGWWPVTARGGTRPRYRPGRFEPPGGRQALEVCLGAILTQNTAWANVWKALVALNGAEGVDLGRLARMPRRRLERLIRPSGYYVQKAVKLKAFVRHALGTGTSLARWLRRSPLAGLRTELLSIHGVGPETADSMLLYAGARPVFVVDAYTDRIGRRLGWFGPDAGYARVQGFFEGRLTRSARVYNECHALLVRLAKDHCRIVPRCGECPLRARCPEGRERRGV